MSGERLLQARIVLVLGLGQIVAFGSSFYLLGVLGDPIASDLGVSPALVFAFLSGALIVSGLFARMGARRIDRHGGKAVLLASNLIFAASLAVMAAAPGPVVLGAGVLLMGVGLAVGMYETPFAILVSRYGDQARGSITGVALLGGLGSTIGWPTTLAMEHLFGWRGACLGWAVIHLLIALPMVGLLVPNAPPRPQAEHRASFAVKLPWDRGMVQLAALFAAAWFISTCMSAHLPRVLQAFGMTPAAAVGAASLIGVAAVSMRLAEFTVLRRFNPLATTRVATLLHPLGAAIMLIFGPRAGAAFALGQGGGNGMLTVAKGVLPLQIYGADNYAVRSAMIGVPARFLQAGGPVFYGLILDRSPVAAVALSSGLCLFMFAMTFGLRRARTPIQEPVTI